MINKKLTKHHKPSNPTHLQKPNTMGSTNNKSLAEVSTKNPVEERFSLSDIPLGQCHECRKKQSTHGADGFWLGGRSEKWTCHDCSNRSGLRYYPRACECCTYVNVVWTQGGGHWCPRCKALNIKSM